MKSKSIISMFLSTLILMGLASSTAMAAEKSIGFVPSGNIAAGDYVVINNESYENEGGTGSLSIKDAKEVLENFEGNGLNKINLNFDKIPEQLKEKKDLNEINKSIYSNSYSVGAKKAFWVANLETNKDYQITATLMYSGTKSEVWVADSKITKEKATLIGEEYDKKISTVIENNFAKPSDIDGNGKVNLLVYDIQDGFNGSGGYVGGYFYSVDLFPESEAIQYGYHSNESEILYIDTYPSMYYGNSEVSPEDAFNTIAHEMQHLVNFVQNFFIEGGDPMPTWINEGLSEAAGQIYSGEASYSRIEYYNQSISITNGHPLMYWSNYNALPNYSLSYLFFQYLRVQAGRGNAVFKEILLDRNNDEKSIENVVKKYIGNMSVGEFTTAFRMALLMKDKTGLYGFKGESAFDKLVPKIFLGNASNGTLYEGGAVVIPGGSNKALNIPTNKDSNIKYFGNYDRYNRADVNRDFKIDMLDIATIASAYNNKTTTSNWYIDPNRDGIFDLFDFTKISKQIK